jgi:hypothetical protein
MTFVLACKAEVKSVDLLVALRTDYIPGSEFTQIDVHVTGTDKHVRSEACAQGKCASFAQAKLVGSFQDLPQQGGRRVEVTLLDAKGKAIASDSGVIDHSERMALVLWITRSCADVSCGAEQRCLGTSCVDARCTDGTQSECRDLQQSCHDDSECPTPACGAAHCEQGLCELEVTGDTCTGGLVCVPSVGCTDGAPIDRPDDPDGSADASDGGVSNPDEDPDVSPPNTENRFPNVEPAATTYLATDGVTYPMFAWIGNEVVLFTRDDTLDRRTMGRILTVYDDIYLRYREVNGRAPAPSQSLAGRAVIAFLPSVSANCSLGFCFSFGQSGIELTEADLSDIYYGVLDDDRDRFDVSPLELLALTFWFYEPQLGYPNTDVVAFGFAICSAYDGLSTVKPTVMERAGQSLDEYRSVLDAFVDTYVALGAPWETTLGNGDAPTNTNNLGGGALMCSMLRRLRARHGEGFDADFWQQVATLPASGGTFEGASDNFLIAASRAAKADLSSVIGDRWRFPVTSAGRAAAKAAGPRVVANSY